MKSLRLNKIIFLTLSLSVGTGVSGIGFTVAQNAAENISEHDAQQLLKTDLQEALKRFKKLGPERVQFLLTQLELGYQLPVTTRLALIDLIAETQSRNASRVLIQLLQSPDVFERGEAVRMLARYPAKEATSKIIELLDDEAVFSVRVSTDPYTENPIKINDLALEALDAMEGKTPVLKEPKDKRRIAWKKWWQKQNKKH